MDFNHSTHTELLKALQSRGFSFLTVSEYAEIKVKDKDESKANTFILLRHDVEARYENALQMARIQHSRGIRGTYYFRIYGDNGHAAVIREIAALGHEIGYHYDDLSHCKGDYEKAIKRFEQNLTYLRQFGPVTSATMEGAPLSRYDNRNLWSARPSSLIPHPLVTEGSRSSSLVPRPPSLVPIFHYRDFGIQTEPYFDLDFNELFYLTDTGRRWDGWKVSVRDKIPGHQERWIKEGLVFRGTRELIKAAREGRLPSRIMITVHPQRWNDGLVAWGKELVLQRVKNMVKGVLLWR